MIFIFIIYGLIICELALQCAVLWIAQYFPYFNAFLTGSIIYYYAKPLHNFIPGHVWLSYLVCICILELVIFALLHFKYTQKGIITLLCISTPSFFLTAIHVTVDSWQMAVLLTVVHLIVLVFETFLMLGKYDVDITAEAGFATTIFNALSYCFAAFMITFSVTYCYWDLYMESIGKGDSFVITKVVIAIISMTLAFLMPVITYGSRNHHKVIKQAAITIMSKEEKDEYVKEQMKKNMEKLNMNTGGMINEQSAANR